MQYLYKGLSYDQAENSRLVLISMDIPHLMKKSGSGWDILVNETEYSAALSALELYFDENSGSDAGKDLLPFQTVKSFTGVWVSVILVAFYLVVTLSGDSQMLVRSCGSSAFHIMKGEVYRTVTSLFIHANVLHLAGNIVGIMLFGTAVCSISGWGTGWFMILLTGITGNLLNAVSYKTGHISIGASTAVFGALGILSGHIFLKKVKVRSQRMKAWLPLGGGIALLAMLGSGAHTDISAHFYGLIAGIIMGIFYTITAKQPPGVSLQITFLLMSLGILIISWMKALGYI
ncbi:MAG: rhomboid family intramembrane serine protease [Desulfobacterales bacterium]|nr:rhomboid family intramembrane serine protease [Desulfobacterales bacterium]